MSNIEFVERFQTLLAGLLAFVGVAVALAGNAWVIRRQAQRAASHTRECLRNAYLAELKSYRNTFDDLDRSMERIADGLGQLLIPAAIKTPVFDANCGNLGQLEEHQIVSVLDAYMCLKEFERSLLLFSHSDKHAEYRAVTEKNRTTINGMVEGLKLTLDRAIDQLTN